jgi:hypothetical protein
MSVFQYRSGLGSSAAYQVSAIPYLSAQTLSAGVNTITFPQVTRFLKIVNLSGTDDVTVGFSLNGVNGANNFLVSATTQTPIYYWRVSKIFLKTTGTPDIEIHAGLTTIAANELEDNWSGSIGVG